MRVLVAPDCFTGTLTAPEAAAAVATGWARHAPDDPVSLLPLSDGGPGFVDALHTCLGGELVPVVVRGPAGQDVPARFLAVAADGPATAYVESAAACGSHLLPTAPPPALARSSTGVGQLIRAAVDHGARRVVVGLGGSGTVDGGAGMLAALGALAGGSPDPLTGGLPVAVAAAELDVTGPLATLAGVEIVVASDVDAPLLGPHGAVLGFGPQKGLATAGLEAAEARMSAWAAALAAAVSRGAADLPGAPGAGAAGGIGTALLALGATRVSGAQYVADAVGLPAAAAESDLVITGEGAFDWQSLRGKVVTAAARAGRTAAVPVVVLAGRVLVGRKELAAAGVDAAYAVAPRPQDVAAAMADPHGTLAALAQRVARTWSPRR